MSASDKLHRWLDILAALLSRRYPLPLSELRREVPGYADESVKEDSILRMFERDKGELRELGVVIDTIPDSDGVSRYQLRKADFYLPLLSVCETLLPSETELRQQPRYGPPTMGGSVPSLVLTPDECHALRRAAARVAGLGHVELAEDAARALRKLQFDLEVFAEGLPAAAVLRVDGDVFDTLTNAVALRKRLRFTYHSMERNETAERVVDPYGLVFLTGHWYLVAHDVNAQGMRQFRVSRIRSAVLGDQRKQHPDFEVPATFDLSTYAASRQSWELGNGDHQTVIVAFRGDTGVVSQGRALGEPVAAPYDGQFAWLGATHSVRSFRVRRRDTFLRWVLSFAGDARPVAPDDAVQEWTALLRASRDTQMAVATEAE
ncbi:helix-turn-helix transcriptional regulator [Gemmatimonas sp.]|jgi:predicted DNA-binding transcriptional regulator YafY|uniref:helix-turn-helix transcriptional regulator n=1 Tax=Gemmatimonas sp. TaxID=1962908 RepID=UPI0031C0F192|nr:WYL domain-containing protein [Gemmatimonas sp.]